MKSSKWKFAMLLCMLTIGAAAAAHAQTSAAAPSPTSASTAPTPDHAAMQTQIDAISAALAATQQQIEQSQHTMQLLQQQLGELRSQMQLAPDAQPAAQSNIQQPAQADSNAAASIPVEERVQALEAAVKLHDQTKVESSSKYPVRIGGLILFNGFLNKGNPDESDLPSAAARTTLSSGSSSLGAGMRQSILSIDADGPRLAGAHTSANVVIDFFSSAAYIGYGSIAGVMRMRTAAIDLDWKHDSIEAGIAAPLISPLSPTSYATLAEPSLAGAGNLWTWAPQLRYTHRLPLHNGKRIQAEFGLWDSPANGYNTSQLWRTANPAELSAQPGYESRLSYAGRDDHGIQIGVGGYYSRQTYPAASSYSAAEDVDSWAATADWRLPFGRVFEVSGEAYRGRALGSLGGGAYKDVITGYDPISGAYVMRPLNAIGGWLQAKTRYTSSLETNFTFGQDGGFARDFHAVVQPASANSLQLRARNQMVVANLIYRPKTYLIFSPEYRRIWTWQITGPPATLDIFTLSIGFQF
jgi:uncharacterized coiled-coil protein SlyX